MLWHGGSPWDAGEKHATGWRGCERQYPQWETWYHQLHPTLSPTATHGLPPTSAWQQVWAAAFIFTGSPVTPFLIWWEMPSMALKEMYRSTKGMKWWCHGLSYFCSWRPWTRPVPRTWGEQWPSPTGTLHFHMGCSRKAKNSLCRAQRPLENSTGPLLVTVGLSSHLNCLFFLFPSFTPLSFFFLPLFKWGNGCYCTASVKRSSLSFKFWHISSQRHMLF